MSFPCLELASRRIFISTFTGEADQPVVTPISNRKIWGTSAFFQFCRSSPDHQNLSNIIRSGLTVTFPSSLSTHGCLLPGPMDLHMLTLFKCSLTRSLPKSKSSLFQTFLTCLRNLGLLRASLSSRGQNEEGFEHLSFFSVLCHQVTCLTQMQDHIFFLLLLRSLLVFLSLSALPTSNSKQALVLLTPYSVPGSPVHAPTCSILFFFWSECH